MKSAGFSAFYIVNFFLFFPLDVILEITLTEFVCWSQFLRLFYKMEKESCSLLENYVTSTPGSTVSFVKVSSRWCQHIFTLFLCHCTYFLFLPNSMQVYYFRCPLTWHRVLVNFLGLHTMRIFCNVKICIASKILKSSLYGLCCFTFELLQVSGRLFSSAQSSLYF